MHPRNLRSRSDAPQRSRRAGSARAPAGARARERTRRSPLPLLWRLDALVFSSVWPAAVAGACVAATAAALGAPPDARVARIAAFASCGTLVIYGIDRLRDVVRDRATSPARARFVERHRTRLVGLVALAGLGAGALAPWLPVAGLALCAAVVGLGLLHRRLKRLAALKTAYVTAAWLAVVVALPSIALGAAPGAALHVAAVLGLAIGANLVASNLRDREAAAAALPAPRVVAFGGGLCALALVVCALGPPARWPLALVPALEGLAIAPLGRLGPAADRERYGLAVVDGALWVGALAATVAMSAG